MNVSLPFEEYSGTTGQVWPAIAQARAESRAVHQTLKQSLGQFEDGDVNVVLFGSIARQEWTSGSDVDWTLLVDGIANAGHYKTAQLIQSTLSELEHNGRQLVKPGKSGVFGTLTFSHDLVHHLGGQSDTNINTTRRVLLILESVALRNDARRQTLRAILCRYLEDDFRFEEEGHLTKVPRFLLNDIVRFWRTLCVDYGMKRWTEEKNWALRNVKLRMSRKWLFASGLLMMFACDERAVSPEVTEGTRDRTMDKLVRLADLTPTDIIIDQLRGLGLTHELDHLLRFYDEYLAKIDDQDIRTHLSNLTPVQARNDEIFMWFKNQGRMLQDVLGETFFSVNRELQTFTKEYGVF